MKNYKNYETYNDSFLSPEPVQEKETESDSETDYDNPDPPEEEPETDLTTMLFKQLLTSF